MSDQQFIDELSKRIDQLIAKSIPPGFVGSFLRGEVPDGWLMLNGQKVYQKVHANLYGYLSKLSQLSKGSDSTGAYVTLPDLDGRVLQGTNDPVKVGQLLEASLPNITGSTIIQEGSNTGLLWPEAIVTGAFVKGDASKGSPVGAKGYPGNHLNLDASQCNALYSGTTNQPKAGLTLLCIKF